MDCCELLKKYPTSLDFSAIGNIQGDSIERSIFCGGGSSGNFEKKSSYAHVSNSESLPIYSRWNLAFSVRVFVSCFVRFLFVPSAKETSLQKKRGYIGRTACLYFG